eukprot:2445034-Pyramimonas_sp.AAC.1
MPCSPPGVANWGVVPANASQCKAVYGTSRRSRRTVAGAVAAQSQSQCSSPSSHGAVAAQSRHSHSRIAVVAAVTVQSRRSHGAVAEQ